MFCGEDTEQKVLYLCVMQKKVFQFLAKCNKLFLPSLTKKQVDLAKASKGQLLLIAWRAYVTMRAI
jgi:hypothetical protein